MWTTYLLTCLLTPWSRVLLEKLTGLQLIKKFPAFYGTRRYITALTSARHMSLSWASSIHSVPHIPSWRSILILSSHLHVDLLCGLFPNTFSSWHNYVVIQASFKQLQLKHRLFTAWFFLYTVPIFVFPAVLWTIVDQSRPTRSTKKSPLLF
jgi:hypothetical protein